MNIPAYIQKYKLELVSFVVGGTVLAFELTAARIVAPYIGTTIYTWTSVIGVILAALAAGYATGGIVADQRKSANDVVLLLLGSAIALILVIVLKDWVLSTISQQPISLRWQALLASLILFSIPTFLMGMISPYLARLSITKLSSSGSSLSRISAAGTLGSLFGTFITGYVLFYLLGSRYILTWLSIVLILTSLFLSVKYFLAFRIFLLMMAFCMLLFAPHATLVDSSVVDDFDTQYSRILITDRYYDNKPIRVLQMDNLAWQSGVFKGGSKDLVFSYTKAFAEVLKAQPQAKNILIIGGGSFSFPEYTASVYPNTKIDVVEIDPQLTVVAKKYFNFQQPPNVNIINQDGRQFLNESKDKYDIIFLDVFTSLVPPYQLMTKQAVQKAQNSLSSDGIVVLNVISSVNGSRSMLTGALVATYESVFNGIDFYQVDGNIPKTIAQNLLLVASSNTIDKQINSQLIASGARTFHTANQPNSFKYTKILTDDFAPVELLTIHGIN